MERQNVLSVQNLVLDFHIKEKDCHAIDDVSMEIFSGEMVALVGESGCGKTLTALSAIGLQPATAMIRQGKILFQGTEMTHKRKEDWNNLRGADISMVFQEPMTALNPLLKVGKQIAENAVAHGSDKKTAYEKALKMMEMVGLPDSKRLYQCYPHQLSGGMRQRIMIGMALINSPSLLIADEPTTALDVTIQAQIMELIKDMNKQMNTAVMLISHDLGVVSNMCDRVYIMYAGEIIESGNVKDIIFHPLHPYTNGLIQSIPNIAKKNQRLQSIQGNVPSLENRKNIGCQYANRCEHCMEICKTQRPIRIVKENRMVACHLYTKGGF